MQTAKENLVMEGNRSETTKIFGQHLSFKSCGQDAVMIPSLSKETLIKQVKMILLLYTYLNSLNCKFSGKYYKITTIKYDSLIKK